MEKNLNTFGVRLKFNRVLEIENMVEEIAIASPVNQYLR